MGLIKIENLPDDSRSEGFLNRSKMIAETRQAAKIEQRAKEALKRGDTRQLMSEALSLNKPRQ